jgi:hypothetical protein
MLIQDCLKNERHKPIRTFRMYAIRRVQRQVVFFGEIRMAERMSNAASIRSLSSVVLVCSRPVNLRHCIND